MQIEWKYKLLKPNQGIYCMTPLISPPCVSIYLIYVDKEGSEYLLIRRTGKYLTGTWQMVSGGINSGEKAYEAALRECYEETKIVPDRFYSADAVETFYMQTIDKIVLVPVFVGLLDKKPEVVLSSGEHDAFAWLPFEEAKERLLFTEQKRIITTIHKNFIMKSPNPFFLIENKANVSN